MSSWYIFMENVGGLFILVCLIFMICGTLCSYFDRRPKRGEKEEEAGLDEEIDNDQIMVGV